MRLRRVIAIAQRDLRIEFAGRRVPILPAIAAFLLLPIAMTPPSGDSVRKLIHWKVWGDVPEDVLALPEVVVEKAHDSLRFEAPSADGQTPWILHGPGVPTAIRQVMDARDPNVTVRTIKPPPITLPARSLFLSLISASILMGALSQSIPGERSQGSLETLLTASITRMELVTGKWLAWGGFGALSAMLAVVAALARGVQAPGWWVLAVPWVSLGTVALGFYLVRKANDVIGGATVAIRMLPVALAVLGLLSWYLGSINPYLGASVPIGGALLASGATWPGAGPTLWAVVSSGAASAAMLAATARDLDTGERQRQDAGLAGALVVAVLALLAWWTPVLGALLWAAGGAPERTDAVPAEAGAVGGALGLLLLVVVRLSRDPRPAQASGWQLPDRRLAWMAAAIVGVVLAGASGLPSWPAPPTGLGGMAADRFAAALQPGWAGGMALVAAVVAQETLFRGWIRQQAGELAQGVLFVAVCTPFDPLRGAVVAVLLGGLTRVTGGSVLPAIVARLVWAVVLWPAQVGPAALALSATAALAWVALAGGRSRAPVTT